MVDKDSNNTQLEPVKFRWLPFSPFLVFTILATVFFFSIGRDPTLEANGMVGQAFPDFIAVSLPLTQPTPLNSQIASESLTLDDVLAVVDSGPWILNVWASWCPQCYYEHGFVSTLADKGAPVIGLNYKDSTEKANGFLNKMGNPYTLIIADTTGDLGLDLGVSGAPETYLINSAGIIVVRHAGVIDRRIWDEKFASLWQKEVGATLFEGDIP